MNAQPDDDVADRIGLPSPGRADRQVRLLLDAYGLPRADRVGFVDELIEVAVRAARADAVTQQVTPDSPAAAGSGDPVMLASPGVLVAPAWILDHRIVLDRVLAQPRPKRPVVDNSTCPHGHGGPPGSRPRKLVSTGSGGARPTRAQWSPSSHTRRWATGPSMPSTASPCALYGDTPRPAGHATCFSSAVHRRLRAAWAARNTVVCSTVAPGPSSTTADRLGPALLSLATLQAWERSDLTPGEVDILT